MTDHTVPAPSDSWTVAIHRTATDTDPIGAGVVIHRHRILTCAHLLQSEQRWLEEVWVTFPKAGIGHGPRHRVTRYMPAKGFPGAGIDLAVLDLDTPAPHAVTPAPVRCLAPRDLPGGDWWAFGFPTWSAAGDVAIGRIGPELAFGLVRLDTVSQARLAGGYSGSAVWSPSYRAVVGLVVNAANGPHGNGQALTLHQVDQAMPELRLAALAKWGADAADPAALAAWGWSLREDPEVGRHWRPHGLGARPGGEASLRFQGRVAALHRIVSWLDRPVPDGRLLVLTGSPGAGKSAVLGRIVTTADPELRQELPPDDHGIRARGGAVSCAVHVKGKTALEVAIEIARGASVRLPDEPEDLVPALRDRLEGRRRDGMDGRFNLVVDALDEAVSPSEARRLATAVLLPLAASGADLDAQVLVGTRARDAEGDLLGYFEKAQIIDLDHPDYFSEPDLTAYTAATLRLAAAGRPGSPYTDPARTTPVAHQIAALAGGNFLVAGLVARAYGEHDGSPVTPDQLPPTSTVEDALDAYLDGLPPVGTAPARLALTVLAYAEAPGLPLPLWQAGVFALGGAATEDELAAFVRRPEASFLVGTNTGPVVRAYRLSHQAVGEALRRHRAGHGHVDDERRLFEAWLHAGRNGPGWSSGYDYPRQHLAAHARRAGRIDTLLADDRYLLHADLRRLALAAETVHTPAGRARARLLRLTPQAFDAGPSERAAMFSVTGRLDRLGSGFDRPAGAAYHVRWTQSSARTEFVTLTGHTDRVCGIVAVTVGDRQLLASAGEDATVRLWELTTGEPGQVLSGHTAAVRVVCPVPSGPAGPPSLLASAGEDGTVRLWDPRTGRCQCVLTGHTDWVRGLCAVTVAGRRLLASASDDHTVRLWDPVTGHCELTLAGDPGWMTAVTPVDAGGRQLLATAGYDPVIRLWDPGTGTLVRTMDGPAPWVTVLCAVRAGDRDLLAAGGYGPGIALLDPVAGGLVRELRAGPGPVTGLATVTVAGALLLAATTEAGVVRLWDPATGRPVRDIGDHTGGVGCTCAVRSAGRGLLATAGDDGAIRLWDPATGKPERVLNEVGPVTGLAALIGGRATRLASTGRDGSVRLWDPATGEPGRQFTGHTAPVTSVCGVTVRGVELLAAGGEDRTVRLWEPSTGRPVRTLIDDNSAVTALCAVPGPDTGTDRLAVASDTLRLWHPGTGEVERVLGNLRRVTAVCVVPALGAHLLASSDDGGTVRLWDLATGALERELHCHHGAATALCAVPTGDLHLLASASADQTVLLWDPLTGARVGVLAGHTGPVTGLCVIAGDRNLLASTSTDRTVRLWDPVTCRMELSIPVHHPALACWADPGTLVIGLDTGLLALTLSTTGHAEEPPNDHPSHHAAHETTRVARPSIH